MNKLGLGGLVRKSSAGVEIEVEGERAGGFAHALRAAPPPLARIAALTVREVPPRGEREFVILPSRETGAATEVSPDVATCADCLREVLDPADRRHRYPFTNCTHCGPRFSIMTGLPYDRPRTTMAAFTMCADCAREYADPLDRRFHAQPNACPACGPRAALWGVEGGTVAERDDALRAAADLLREGRVLAVKGVGGFHLLVDATSDHAVARLRRAKGRLEKPLAVMARAMPMPGSATPAAY